MEVFIMNTRTIRRVNTAVVTFTGLFLLAFGISASSSEQRTLSERAESALVRAPGEHIEHTHDLAIISVKAPKAVTLSTTRPTATQSVMVAVQNRGTDIETIKDLSTLARLVQLSVIPQASGAGCPAPVATLHVGKPQAVLPVSWRPNKAVTIVFDVTFTCGSDPAKGQGHEDFHYLAQVNASALDGQEDVNPASDVCPRLPTPAVDGVQPDKGCGGKLSGKTLGGPVLTDVVLKGKRGAFPSSTLTISLLGNGSGRVTSLPAGIDCGNDCSEAYLLNYVVTLTPSPDSGSVFAGWGGVCSGAGTCSVTMNATKFVTATFQDSAPTISFPAGMPPAAGLLGEATLTFQSSENGTYVVERGGNGAQGSGTQIAAGTVLANSPVNVPIAGKQLSYLAPTEVWVYVTDAKGNTGTDFGEVALKPYISIPVPATFDLSLSSQLLINNAGTRLYVGMSPLLVIDIDSGSADYDSIIAAPDVGSGNNLMALTPDDSRLYVTASQSNRISVIDTNSNTVSTTFPSNIPEDIAITPDGTRAYIGNFGSEISVVDVNPESASYHSVIDAIPNIAFNPLFLSGHAAIAPDGRIAVIHWNGLLSNGVDELDVDPASPSYNTPIATPVPAIGTSSASEVIVSPDSRFAYVYVGGPDGFKKIDLIDYSTVVAIDHATGGMALTPDGQWLLTGKGITGDLYILDAENLATTGVVPLVPETPYPGNNFVLQLAVTPDGQSAYAVIADYDGVTVSWKLVMLPLQ
jgi:YVTN family beta-propeller protein